MVLAVAVSQIEWSHLSRCHARWQCLYHPILNADEVEEAVVVVESLPSVGGTARPTGYPETRCFRLLGAADWLPRNMPLPVPLIGDAR